MNAREWIEKFGRKGLSYEVCENRLGLKYFAGVFQNADCTVPDFGAAGPYNTRGELLREYRSKYPHVRFLYPYPSADFIEAVYSDDYLPGINELKQNAPSHYGVRLQLFDEPSAWQSVIAEGLFGELAGTFIIEYGEKPVCPEVIFQKLPTNRGPEYALVTSILRDENGERYVTKTAESDAAEDHLKSIHSKYQRLREVYSDGQLAVNECELKENGGKYEIRLRFEEGSTLTSMLDECLRDDDTDGFFDNISVMMDALKARDGRIPYCSLDTIFDNFIITDPKEMRGVLIDYEWADSDVELKLLIYRALRHYFEDDHLRGDYSGLYEQARKIYGISAADKARFFEWENKLQSTVGEGAPQRPLADAIPYSELDSIIPESSQKKYCECFVDLGEGFSADTMSICESCAIGEGRRRIRIPCNGARRVRFDPAESPGVLSILDVSDENGRAVRVSKTNASARKGNNYLFTTPDPQVFIKPKRGSGELVIKYRFSRIPVRAAEAMRAMF